MKSLVATICLVSLYFAQATTDDNVCEGYIDLLTRFDQGRVDCKDLSDAIVPGEQGCELREEVAATMAYFTCVLSQEYLGWMDEDGKYVWDKVLSEFEEIQVEDELDGVAEACHEEAFAITRNELEVVAAEMLSPGVEVGEQEECWNTDEAEIEVKRLYLIVCLTRGIGENAPTECQPPPPPFLFH